MHTLPQIAAKIAFESGEEVNALHTAIRGYRDKGAISHSGFEGRKALYDDVALCRIAVLLALQQHGFEGVALQAILRCLDNHHAPIAPNVPTPKGFGRVVAGISSGEAWTFRFSAGSRKMFFGGCKLEGIDSYDLLQDEDAKTTFGFKVVTAVDLSALLAPLLAD